MKTETDLTTITLKQILSPDCSLFSAREDSKKRVFELIARITTKNLPHIDAKSVFDGLISREKIGSTAIGHGVAIPHTRVTNLHHPVAAFIQLQEPIAFDAQDEQPVDLFFGILVPAEECSQHLHLLSQLAKIFQVKENRERCRNAGNSHDLYTTLLEMSETASS